LRDEFIDVYDSTELINRVKNEILPLPILFALADKTIKDQLQTLLASPKISKKKAEALLDIVLESKKSQEVKEYMRELANYGVNNVAALPACKEELADLLFALLEDIT
jgi:geranylgeranyl pyrophosphate synthase